MESQIKKLKEKFKPLVDEVLKVIGQESDELSRRLVAMIYVESRGNNLAVSPVGALGLLQIMPDTFRLMKKTYPKYLEELELDDIWDEFNNILVGALVLTDNLKYSGLDLATKRYNSGSAWKNPDGDAGVEYLNLILGAEKYV